MCDTKNMPRNSAPRPTYEPVPHVSMPMPMPMPPRPTNTGRVSRTSRPLSPTRESRGIGGYPSGASENRSNRRSRDNDTHRISHRLGMPSALSPPLSPTLEATATPFAPGEFYPPLANNTVGPERSMPQYFPLSQWLQAPWIRGITSRLPDISIPMPMPIHYVFKPKKVQLTDGNLVLDTPVPTSYLTAVDHQTGNEFEKLRYTAVTCDADMMPEGRYRLRAQNMKRPIELAICLTVNEVCISH